MQSSSYLKVLGGVAALVLLAGCATRAPALPEARGPGSRSLDARGPVSSGDQAGSPNTLVMPFAPPAAPAVGVVQDLRPDAVIASRVWDGLTEAERDRLKLQYATQVLRADGYGTIVDVQGVDRSTPGTTAGAHLGGAIAGAAYLDRGLRGGNYSAGGALAATLLGAAIGSTMDRRPQARYQFRYTVRQGDGEMRYVDEHTSAPFRHSPGLCVRVPELTQVGQHVCEQTPESVRQRYLAVEWTPPAAVAAPVGGPPAASSAVDAAPAGVAPAPAGPAKPVL